ncbi:MAG: class C sortase, partial [Blautia sp.]
MGRKVFNFAVALLFLAGAGVLLYPLVSDWWNQRQQDQVIRDYEKTVGGRSKEELDKMRQKAQEYNENLLRDEIIIDPFD